MNPKPQQKVSGLNKQYNTKYLHVSKKYNVSVLLVTFLFLPLLLMLHVNIRLYGLLWSVIDVLINCAKFSYWNHCEYFWTFLYFSSCVKCGGVYPEDE